MILPSFVSEASFSEPSSGKARLPLTEGAVESIVAIRDDAVRNLWITQSYADLAARMLHLLKSDQSWCTFAVWASNTAGISIRGNELPEFATKILMGVDSHIDHLVTEAVDQVSALIANGNTLVFRELAPLFVRFIDHFTDAHETQSEDIESTLDLLGFPTALEAPLVRKAFRHYAFALGSPQGRTRAQHVLTANIAAVLHEQKRLQNDIAAALDVGLEDFGDELCSIAYSRLAKDLLRPVEHEIRAHISCHLETLWQHIVTRLLMTMSVPGQTLRLSEDVPRIPGHAELFPGDLLRLNQVELIALLGEWDPTHGTGRGSGARDWADLHQRMGYIVNLFRSRQQHLGLTGAPFTSTQLSWMSKDLLPPSLSHDTVS